MPAVELAPLISGFRLTALLYLAALLGSGLVGWGLYSLQSTSLKAIRYGSRIVIEILRNTPLLIQLFFVYHLCKALSPIGCTFLVLSLQTGAYIAQILRAGFEAIPAGQKEAALSLGLSPWRVWLQILLPQAWGTMLPALGNQAISLMKNTAIASFISVPDLFYMIYQGSAEQFAYLQYFGLGIGIYLLLSLGITALVGQWERRLPWRQPLPAYLLGEPG